MPLFDRDLLCDSCSLRFRISGKLRDLEGAPEGGEFLAVACPRCQSICETRASGGYLIGPDVRVDVPKTIVTGVIEWSPGDLTPREIQGYEDAMRKAYPFGGRVLLIGSGASIRWRVAFCSVPNFPTAYLPSDRFDLEMAPMEEVKELLRQAGLSLEE